MRMQDPFAPTGIRAALLAFGIRSSTADWASRRFPLAARILPPVTYIEPRLTHVRNTT